MKYEEACHVYKVWIEEDEENEESDDSYEVRSERANIKTCKNTKMRVVKSDRKKREKVI
jgi:hypothetical protein